MSTIKVNRIENTSTTDGGVSIDVDGHVQVDGLQMPAAGPLSNRNLIMNGAMQVSQRGTTFNYSGTSQTVDFNIDRWKISCFGSYPSGNYLEITQDTDVPSIALAGTKFPKSQKLKALQNIPVSASESRGIWTQESIEGQNIEHLGFGAANASTVTISFWVKASKTGTFSVALKSSNSDLSYVTPVTISAANTWQYCTKTIAGPTTGTFNTDNTSGFSLHFTWALDPTWIATATTDQWVAGNFVGTTTQSNMLSTTNDAVWLTGVQLEVGSKATPFEHESYGQTLAKCQRYFTKVLKTRGSGTGDNGTYTCIFSHRISPEMRDTPNVSGIPTSGHGLTSISIENVDATHIAVTATTNGSYYFYNDGYELSAEL